MRTLLTPSMKPLKSEVSTTLSVYLSRHKQGQEAGQPFPALPLLEESSWPGVVAQALNASTQRQRPVGCAGLVWEQREPHRETRVLSLYSVAAWGMCTVCLGPSSVRDSFRALSSDSWQLNLVLPTPVHHMADRRY